MRQKAGVRVAAAEKAQHSRQAQTFINKFQLLPVNEAAGPVPTREDGLDDVAGDLLPLLVRECGVPFLQPQLPLSTEEQDEMYHGPGSLQQRLPGMRGPEETVAARAADR